MDNLLSDLASIATIVEALAVAITLFYVYKQTKITQQNISDIKQQMRIGSLISWHDHTREVNSLLCQDDDLAEDFGYTEQGLIAYSIINNMELRWAQFNEGVISDQQWSGHETTIFKVMSKDSIRKYWPSIKDEYHPGFVSYVDNLIESHRTKTIEK